jgi:hypothetical protein
MAFALPAYYAPDFSQEKFRLAPDAAWAPAPKDGVAPEYYHSTSMYPEYFKLDGEWKLAQESRMDSSVVIGSDGTLHVVENRNLKCGDKVILGRSENCEEGIYLHCHGQPFCLFRNIKKSRTVSNGYRPLFFVVRSGKRDKNLRLT